MPRLDEIDFNNVWKETMGWYAPERKGRKFEDVVEQAFWEKLAPRYTKDYDLNRDTTVIAERMKELIGPGQSILEIGCGSGNFTMLMAAYSRRILGLDFSAAMLKELEKRKAAAGCDHIHTQVGKWEDFETEERFDCLVSVNSLYRICDMKAALLKMKAYAKRIVIVRTIQRSLFYPLYQQLELDCGECRDYQLIPMLLWQNGLLADVEFHTYPVKRSFSEFALEETMRGDLGDTVFDTYRGLLYEAFKRCAIPSGIGYEVCIPRTTAIISAKKIAGV